MDIIIFIIIIVISSSSSSSSSVAIVKIVITITIVAVIMILIPIMIIWIWIWASQLTILTLQMGRKQHATRSPLDYYMSVGIVLLALSHELGRGMGMNITARLCLHASLLREVAGILSK